LHRGQVLVTSIRSTTITTSHARPVGPIPSRDLSNGRAQRVDIERLHDDGADSEARGMVIEVGGRKLQHLTDREVIVHDKYAWSVSYHHAS
jgi:hypothetical protein